MSLSNLMQYTQKFDLLLPILANAFADILPCIYQAHIIAMILSDINYGEKGVVKCRGIKILKLE